MENQTQNTQQMSSNRKKSWSALLIIIVQIFSIFLYFIGVVGNFSDQGGFHWSITSITMIFSIVLLFILSPLFSIKFYRDSNRGIGKIYGLLDLIITLIIPVIILFIVFIPYFK